MAMGAKNTRRENPGTKKTGVIPLADNEYPRW